MTDADGRPEKGLVWWLFLGSPLFIFGFAFAGLYITYLLAGSVAPDLLGEVADRPATFAALIALVALPMDLALMAAFSWSRIRAMMAGESPPPEPARTGWRRLGTRVATLLPNVAAALIVITTVVDAPPASLPVITVLGPVALSWSLTGLGALRRWGWRRWTSRGHEPRHAVPDDRPAEETAERAPSV